MNKIASRLLSKITFMFLVFFLSVFLNPQQVRAERKGKVRPCSEKAVFIRPDHEVHSIPTHGDTANFTISNSGTDMDESTEYFLEISGSPSDRRTTSFLGNQDSYRVSLDVGGITFPGADGLIHWTLYIRHEEGGASTNYYCKVTNAFTTDNEAIGSGSSCSATTAPPIIDISTPIDIRVENLTENREYVFQKQPSPFGAVVSNLPRATTDDDGSLEITHPSIIPAGQTKIKIYEYNVVAGVGSLGIHVCDVGFRIEENIDSIIAAGSGYVPLKACENIPDASLKGACISCMGDDEANGKVWTALGCIDANPSGFVTQFIQLAVGLGGGVSFLLLIFGAFLMTTSAGDPKAVENARGVITGAISGLLLIIFSVVILNFIGVEVLKIPGF